MPVYLILKEHQYLIRKNGYFMLEKGSFHCNKLLVHRLRDNTYAYYHVIEYI